MWEHVVGDRVVNVPLQYIAKDLGFAGNALIQGSYSIYPYLFFSGCGLSWTLSLFV